MRHHKYIFDATLREDGKGYQIEITHECIGQFTPKELMMMVENLKEEFTQQLLICITDSIKEATPISQN